MGQARSEHAGHKQHDDDDRSFCGFVPEEALGACSSADHGLLHAGDIDCAQSDSPRSTIPNVPSRGGDFSPYPMDGSQMSSQYPSGQGPMRTGGVKGPTEHAKSLLSSLYEEFQSEGRKKRRRSRSTPLGVWGEMLPFLRRELSMPPPPGPQTWVPGELVFVQAVPTYGFNVQLCEALGDQAWHPAWLHFGRLVPAGEASFVEWTVPEGGGSAHTLSDRVQIRGVQEVGTLFQVRAILVAGFAALAALHRKRITLWGLLDFNSIVLVEEEMTSNAQYWVNGVGMVTADDLPAEEVPPENIRLSPIGAVISEQAVRELLHVWGIMPEGPLDDFRFGAAADVRALGIIGLRLLLGRPPNLQRITEEVSGLSDPAQHLFQMTLTADPQWRITAAKAANHRFLVDLLPKV